eukprot:9648979-Lingulodinium_polyedra.AAC.1
MLRTRPVPQLPPAPARAALPRHAPAPNASAQAHRLLTPARYRVGSYSCRVLLASGLRKKFLFSAHGELAANMLAREWCRRAHHYYVQWAQAAEDVPFDYESAEAYEDCSEFIDWACGVPTDTQTFARIVEVRGARPNA